MDLKQLFSFIQNKINMGSDLNDCVQYVAHYNQSDYMDYVSFSGNNERNRNVVMQSPELEMVVISWPEHNQSDFHGHPGECIFKVMHGRIEEKLHTTDNRDVSRMYQPTEVGYITNTIGQHKMSALGEQSITLHFYTPLHLQHVFKKI